MKKVALARIKDALSKYLRLAEREEITITRRGKSPGVLIGFKSEDDWFEYRLENHPRFLERDVEAREAFGHGHGLKLEDLEESDAG